MVYSVFKEVDFATSLANGPYRDTGLAEAYRAGMKAPKSSKIFIDFSLYVPSFNAPAGFIASPIFDDDGQRLGVVIAQFPLDKLNRLMTKREGLGETGEAYLVGDDMLMRSDSFLDPVGHSVIASFQQNNKVDTDATRRALGGEKGTDIVIDYNGQPCFIGLYPPLKLKDLVGCC